MIVARSSRETRRTPLLQVVVGDPGALLREPVEVAVVDDEAVPHARQRLGDLVEHGERVLSLSRTTATAPESDRIHCDLLGRAGLVDRDGDAAGEPDRVVGQRPLVAGARHRPDAVADPDARGHEPLGQRPHLGEELGRA